MKKILLALAACVSFAAHAAGGPLDGVYDCALSGVPGSSQAYVTISGQPSGLSVFVVAAVGSSAAFYGYGIGQVTGGTFAGLTVAGQPFSLVADALGVSGTIDVQYAAGPVHVAASCRRIF